MSKTVEELEAEFEELDRFVEKMKAEIIARLKKLEKEQQPKVWQPKGGDFYVSPDGKVTYAPTQKSTREYGVERSTEAKALKAASRMRFFNRTLARLNEMGWDGTLTVSENPAGDVVITFIGSADISYQFLKEAREGRLDL